MSTISNGTSTVTPVTVTGYAATRASRNVLHAIIGTPDPAVTLRPAGLRTGTLEALFDTRADAQSAVTILASDAALTFVDTDHPSISMTFVLDGDVTMALDDDTRALWLVSFDYQEVLP